MSIKCLASIEKKVKKSKFISLLFKVSTLEQISSILEHLKVEHKKAKHICYGYKIKNNIKYHNSSEPNRVAYYSIIEPILKHNLDNVLVITIRYYGGTKLGAGPLLRAYLNNALEVLKILI